MFHEAANQYGPFEEYRRTRLAREYSLSLIHNYLFEDPAGAKDTRTVYSQPLARASAIDSTSSKSQTLCDFLKSRSAIEHVGSTSRHVDSSSTKSPLSGHNGKPSTPSSASRPPRLSTSTAQTDAPRPLSTVSVPAPPGLAHSPGASDARRVDSIIDSLLRASVSDIPKPLAPASEKPLLLKSLSQLVEDVAHFDVLDAHSRTEPRRETILDRVESRRAALPVAAAKELARPRLPFAVSCGTQSACTMVDKSTGDYPVASRSSPLPSPPVGTPRTRAQRTPKQRAPSRSTSDLTLTDFAIPAVRVQPKVRYTPGSIRDTIPSKYRATVLLEYRDAFQSLSESSQSLIASSVWF